MVHAQGQQLDAELRYRGHAFAQSTASTYKSQLRAYFRFCLYSGYRPVRCSSHHLLRYVVFFLVWTLASSSIPSCYLNVARIPHLQCMWLSQPSARTALFISKGSSHGGQQAAAQRCCSAKASNYFPVSVQIFHIKLHGTLGLTNSTDATFWAACVIAFSSFWKSNLLISSTSSFDPHKHLRICDIRVCKWS